MFAWLDRTVGRRLGVMVVIVAGVVLLGSLMLATQSLAARSASDDASSSGVDDVVERPGDVLAQGEATPTPQPFGPILTAPPGATSPAVATSPAPATATLEGPAPTNTPEITATPLPTFDANMLGIQLNPNLGNDGFDTMLWLAERLGVKWIKMQWAWDELEPEPGVFSQTFYKYRIFAQTADQKGFNVMISITKAPDWARASTEEEGPPIDPNALASFITRMMSEVRVDLYGNSYFEAIEVWNEPNLRREWNGAQIGGAQYMQLFDAAYNGIRAGEGGHSVTVITAGLAPTGINDGVTAVDDREFLRQMYAAGLANPAYQNIAIGVHPYGAANPPDARWCGQDDCGEPGYNNHPSWFFIHTLEDYRAIMEQNGDSGRQLWATEFGWGTYEGFTVGDDHVPATPPADPPYLNWIDQETQGQYIIRAFEIGRDLPYVGVMVLWNLNYSNDELLEASDPRAAYALLRGGTDPLRPAFIMIENSPKTNANSGQ